MCHLWQNDEDVSAYADISEWKRMLDDIRINSGADFNVIFGGGEPLLYPDKLLELITYAKKLGLRTSLATSGLMLDKQMVLRLKDANLDYCALTVYSLRAKVHDNLRGIKGSLRRVKNTIRLFKKYAPETELAIDTVLMRPNLKDLLKLTKWVSRSKHVSRIMFQAIMQPFHTKPEGDWYEQDDFAFLWPDDKKLVRKVLSKLRKLKEAEIIRGGDVIVNPPEQFDVFDRYFSVPKEFVKRRFCSTLKGDMVAVMPNGDVTICPYKGAVGNIKNDNLKTILHSERAGTLRDEISQCAQNCHHIVNCWYKEEDIEH